MLREQLFSLGVRRRLDRYLHGCPCEYYGDPAGSAHAPHGRSAGIRSDSQPGPNLKVKSRDYLKFEIAVRSPSNPHLQILPYGQLWISVLGFCPSLSPHPQWPSQRDASQNPRYRVLAWRLTAEQESTIRTRTETKCLCHLAADFGINHETIRVVL